MSMDNVKLGVVLSHAIQNEQFRQGAKDPAKTQYKLRDDKSLKQELANAGLQPLNDEEVAFCHGWAVLASAEFGDDDAKLLQALRELDKPAPGP